MQPCATCATEGFLSDGIAGAYSISFAGWNDDLHDTLSKPVKASCEDREEGRQIRIRLAGEAMCDNL